MAVLRIVNFGGIIPAVAPRALPPNAATSAVNLHAGSQEFRPVLADVTQSSVFDVRNPRTIYRMARDGNGDLNTNPAVGWRAYEDLTYLARWPSNDNDTERTTVSSSDGSFQPRVIDATGEDRVLGVPQPEKPTFSITLGDYFTETDRDSAIETLKAQVLAAVKAALQRAKIGATYTADAIEGYLESGPVLDAAPSTLRARVYAFDAENGVMTDAYVTGVAMADVVWVQSTRKGVWIQADGTPAWMGAAGAWQYAINYAAYGIGYQLVTEASLTTALDALQYIETDQATNIAEVVADLFDPTAAPAQAVIKALQESVQTLEDVLNKRAPGMATEGEVSALQTLLLEVAAKEIWNLMYSNSAQAEEPGVTTGP